MRVLSYALIVIGVVMIGFFGMAIIAEFSDEVARQRICEMVKPEALVKLCTGEPR